MIYIQFAGEQRSPTEGQKNPGGDGGEKVPPEGAPVEGAPLLRARGLGAGSSTRVEHLARKQEALRPGVLLRPHGGVPRHQRDGREGNDQKCQEGRINRY